MYYNKIQNIKKTLSILNIEDKFRHYICSTGHYGCSALICCHCICTQWLSQSHGSSRVSNINHFLLIVAVVESLPTKCYHVMVWHWMDWIIPIIYWNSLRLQWLAPKSVTVLCSFLRFYASNTPRQTTLPRSLKCDSVASFLEGHSHRL